MRILATLVAGLALTACAGGSGASTLPAGHSASFRTNSNAGAPHAIAEFQIFAATARAQPFSLAAAPDGTMWFTEPGLSAIGHIDAAGRIHQFRIPTLGGDPEGIVAGSDGSMYFAEHMGPNYATHVARIAPNGRITEYNDSNFMPIGAAAGPNGTMWFTQSCAGIAILSQGKIKQYLIDGITGQSPAIVRGPDGAMWFSEDGTARIGRIGHEGKLRTYAGPMYQTKYNDVANAVTVGPDGNLWWTAQLNNTIWAMNLRGRVVHQYTIPTPNAAPWGIAAGRDGALWFTESAGNKIGRVTTSGAFSEYALPTPWARPQGIARGRDGSLWFVESGADQLGRIAD